MHSSRRSRALFPYVTHPSSTDLVELPTMSTHAEWWEVNEHIYESKRLPPRPPRRLFARGFCTCGMCSDVDDLYASDVSSSWETESLGSFAGHRGQKVSEWCACFPGLRHRHAGTSDAAGERVCGGSVCVSTKPHRQGASRSCSVRHPALERTAILLVHVVARSCACVTNHFRAAGTSRSGSWCSSPRPATACSSPRRPRRSARAPRPPRRTASGAG